MNKDYRVTVKVRNANLLRAIEAIGEEPGQAFAAKVGMSYHTLNALINMAISPLDKNGDYKPWVLTMCDLLNKMPCELFSEEQHEALETNKASFDAALDDAKRIATNASPERLLLARDARSVLHTLMDDVLTERERNVLDMRFGLTGPVHTLAETGAAENVSQERLRQIEAKALRKLRGATERRKLGDVFMEGLSDE